MVHRERSIILQQGRKLPMCLLAGLVHFAIASPFFNSSKMEEKSYILSTILFICAFILLFKTPTTIGVSFVIKSKISLWTLLV